MPEQTTYKGRPCYIRTAAYVEYLDGEFPLSDTIVLIDADEQSKVMYSSIDRVELTTIHK